MIVLPGIVLPEDNQQLPCSHAATSLSRGKGEGSLLSSSKKLFFSRLQDKERENTALQHSDACSDIPVDEEQLATAVQHV